MSLFRTPKQQAILFMLVCWFKDLTGQAGPLGVMLLHEHARQTGSAHAAPMTLPGTWPAWPRTRSEDHEIRTPNRGFSHGELHWHVSSKGFSIVGPRGPRDAPCHRPRPRGRYVRRALMLGSGVFKPKRPFSHSQSVSS